MRAKHGDIEEAILARIHAVAKPSGNEGPEYLEGLANAVRESVAYVLGAIERGEEQVGPPPAAMLAQARMAAELRIGLAVLLRRYAAGYGAFSDYLQQEIRREQTGGADLVYAVQRELTTLFDRTVQAVTAEYERAAAWVPPPPSQRITQRVNRLLSGELLNSAELSYDLEGYHLGLIVLGGDAVPRIRGLAARLDCRTLLAHPGEELAWAWLGGPERPDSARVEELCSQNEWAEVRVAIGEPAAGLRGWRRSHRQARAAMRFGLSASRRVTSYGRVALIASVIRDSDLVEYLRSTYLEPLAGDPDGGRAIFQTLRAFFAAGHNATSAAADLRVSRQTVTSRLRAAEKRIGKPLLRCAAELETSLLLIELDLKQAN
jgi:hypothetical protein